MKRITSIFWFAVLLFCRIHGFSQQDTLPLPNTYESIEAWLKAGNQSNGSNIAFDESVHDFDTLEKGAPCEWTFTFTNTGTDPLFIPQVKTSSGSVVASWERNKVYAPGEKGWVHVKHDSRGIGNFHKSIMVATNSSIAPKVNLWIKGSIVQALPDTLEPTDGPVNKK